MNLTALMSLIHRRMVWRHVLPWLARALAAGLLVGAALTAASRGLHWDVPAVVLLLAVVAALIVGAAGVLRRPGLAGALRGADGLLDLHNRLLTAWEFRDSQATLPRLQREDLLAIAHKEKLTRRLPLRLSRLDSVLPAAGALLLFGALLVPHAQAPAQMVDRVASSRLKHAVARISATQQSTRNVAKQTSGALSALDRQRQRQIDKLLAQLKRDLAAAQTPAQALKAIARAQDALNRLSNPQAGQQRAALQNLSKTLSSSPATNGLAQAIKQGKPSDVQKAARSLARQLSKMSGAQRAALARTLQAAANAASPDSSLANSLQTAATSLAQGDTAGAQNSLRQSGQRAASDLARSQQQASIDQANTTLDNARNDITSQTGTNSASGNPPAGSGQKTGSGRKSGAGTGQGSKGGARRSGGSGGQGSAKGNGTQGSGSQGSGTGSGKGSGAQGSGNGSGQANGGRGSGNGSGQGTGSGNGNGQGGGRGGTGQGGGQGGGGSRGGNTNGGQQGGTQGDRVFVGGQQSQGPSSSQQGNLNAPSRGHVSSWRAVLPAYERGARDAVDSGSVSPSDQGLVKGYFNALDQFNH